MKRNFRKKEQPEKKSLLELKTKAYQQGFTITRLGKRFRKKPQQIYAAFTGKQPTLANKIQRLIQKIEEESK